MTLDFNTQLYRAPAPRSEELLDHLKKKHPWSHFLTTKQWKYQGRNLKHEESSIRYPVEAYKEERKKGLCYGLPIARGTINDSHAFINIQNSPIEVENIPKEVEKKSYNDIILDDLILRAFVLFQLSLNIIDLSLIFLELIDWDLLSLKSAPLPKFVT